MTNEMARYNGLATRLALAVVVAFMAATLIVWSPLKASAVTAQSLEVPFPCGQQWRQQTRADHPTGSGSTYAVDLNWGSGDDDYGSTVISSAPGRVVQAGGSYGTVIIDHNNGWTTTYTHLATIAVTVNQAVGQGQLVGTVGKTSPRTISAHLHYEQRFNGVLQPIAFHGQPITYSGTITSQNCGGSSGSYQRTPDGTIWVVAGNAKYPISSWSTYVSLGTPPYVNVTAAEIAKYDETPDDGTMLRDPANGTIYQIIGGSRYAVPSWQTYLGIKSTDYVNAPYSWISTFPSTGVSGTKYLRDYASGTIWVVINGAKFAIPSWNDYVAMGSPTYTNTTSEFIYRSLGSVPAGTTYLRNPYTMAIYLVSNGQKAQLTLSEWESLGFPEYVNVPPSWLVAIPNA